MVVVLHAENGLGLYVEERRGWKHSSESPLCFAVTVEESLFSVQMRTSAAKRHETNFNNLNHILNLCARAGAIQARWGISSVHPAVWLQLFNLTQWSHNYTTFNCVSTVKSWLKGLFFLRCDLITLAIRRSCWCQKIPLRWQYESGACWHAQERVTYQKCTGETFIQKHQYSIFKTNGRSLFWTQWTKHQVQ